MTPEDLDKIPLDQWNALIAQRCGWNLIPTMSEPNGRWCHPTVEGAEPDFITSLDAMAQAEATLTGDGRIDYYCVHLPSICEADTSDWMHRQLPRLISATAQQRSRAFLLATEP